MREKDLFRRLESKSNAVRFMSPELSVKQTFIVLFVYLVRLRWKIGDSLPLKDLFSELEISSASV